MKKPKKFKDGVEEVPFDTVQKSKPKKIKRPPQINPEKYSKKAYLRDYYEEE